MGSKTHVLHNFPTISIIFIKLCICGSVQMLTVVTSGRQEEGAVFLYSFLYSFLISLNG